MVSSLLPASITTTTTTTTTSSSSSLEQDLESFFSLSLISLLLRRSHSVLLTFTPSIRYNHISRWLCSSLRPLKGRVHSRGIQRERGRKKKIKCVCGGRDQGHDQRNLVVGQFCSFGNVVFYLNTYSEIFFSCLSVNLRRLCFSSFLFVVVFLQCSRLLVATTMISNTHTLHKHPYST